MNTMKKIAIIGECMIELNGQPFSTMQQSFGGDSLNSALYLSRCMKDQVEVNYVTAMGCDALSEGIVSRWKEEGIHTQWVMKDEKRQPGLYLIQLDEQGERTFLYWRNNSAARYLVQHPSFKQVSQDLEGVDWIYLSGISLAILPHVDRLALISRLQVLQQQGVKIAFDTNYRPALWENHESARLVYNAMFEITELALVTNDDEQHLWGDSNEQATLKRLHNSGVKQAVVKMGANGNLYSVQGQPEVTVPACPVDKVIDTTSAGDAFNAGFMAGVLAGKSAEESSQQGHQLASVVIQHKGAIISQQSMQHINFTI